MLQPKRQKYRKQQRRSMGGKAMTGSDISFGEYGIKSLGRGWVTANELESARKAIAHYTKRQGKMWTRVFPDKPYTKRAAGARMGGGKGDIAGYVVVIKPGRILFELSGVDEAIAKEAVRRAVNKLSVPAQFVKKTH
jgi:large subunit ribosomal protein L16